MDRDEPAALDKDALIELIVRLYDRVTELESKVGRPPNGPGNSSIPPSAGYKADRAERRRKKRGEYDDRQEREPAAEPGTSSADRGLFLVSLR
jgi:hypothetical protein